MKILKVLIACEESQTVCKAFRELGHDAYSNDIIECSGGHPEWHLQMDALEAIKLKDWDLVIAHPPCTYLSNAGACRLFPKAGVINNERLQKGFEAKGFFMAILNYCITNNIPCCIENPVPTTIFQLPKRTQVIQPYQFGNPYSKKTYLWLNCLPLLKPTNICDNWTPYIDSGASRKSARGKGIARSAKQRSKTFQGIAKAMAEQWSEYILTHQQTKL